MLHTFGVQVIANIALRYSRAIGYYSHRTLVCLIVLWPKVPDVGEQHGRKVGGVREVERHDAGALGEAGDQRGRRAAFREGLVGFP